jgi:hypothetical protein
MHVEELAMATGWSTPAGEGESVWFTQNRMTIVATAESTSVAYARCHRSAADPKNPG